jgi:hypothetical protein
MATVLLRMAGLDALDLDAEPEPPDGALGEVEERIRTGEGKPLSVRMALGRPYSLKTASNTENA